MYKLLLCWRYLLTRYLALACIISVMLGVATLIVVNSVMGGFSTKLKDRLHSVTSDVVVEGPTLEGFGGADSLYGLSGNDSLRRRSSPSTGINADDRGETRRPTDDSEVVGLSVRTRAPQIV